MADLAFDVSGRKPCAFPGVAGDGWCALQGCGSFFLLGGGGWGVQLRVSSSSILLASWLFCCTGTLSPHCAALNVVCSVKDVACSSSYLPVKGTGLSALGLSFPRLSSLPNRPHAFSVVASSLSYFPWSFLAPVKERPLGKHSFPSHTSLSWGPL